MKKCEIKKHNLNVFHCMEPTRLSGGHWLLQFHKYIQIPNGAREECCVPAS